MPEKVGRHNITLNPLTNQLELNIRLNEVTTGVHIIMLSEEYKQGSFDDLLKEVIKIVWF